MEVHAVSGGWVLEWSGCTGSSIVKATVGVAGVLVVASGVVQGVRHRSLRWYSHKGRLGRDNNKEPDAAVSNQATKELEGEIGGASQAPDNQRVAMATARASDLPLLDVSGADSPRSRIGRGLESIGGLTAGTLQRLSTAVGGVVKSPVVLMAKAGGLASPRAATLTAPPGSSLEERVFHLEIQMKSFEEKFSSRTVVTELDLSPRSHKEKPRIAKSLLQETGTEGTLVKRVQMLEDRLNERMERIEKALSSIQSQLDDVEFSRREIVAGYERQESLSGEPHYYDAEQQSDNFETLEALEENHDGAHDVPGEATGGSPTLEKSRVKETSSAAPTTAEHVEPLQEIDAGKNDDFLEPQVSTSVYSKEAFLTQPMKSTAPSSEPAESVHRDDAGNLPASSDRRLASTLEELHGSFVTESTAAAASAKFLEIARADTAEKSTLAHASSEPQSASLLEEPREGFPEEPSAAVPVAKPEEHAQEDAADKSGTIIAAAESPSPPTFEATQKDFAKESLPAAPNAKPAQELATQEDGDIALASSEPPVTSKSVEEPSVAAPSANSEEPAQEDTGDKSVTMTAAGESPKAFAFQDTQEDFAKESLAGAPGAGPAREPSSQEDSSTTSDMALASSESPVASNSVEEPSAAASGANFEEPARKDAADKSGSTIAAAELPLASSSEEPQEESVKEFMAAAPRAESAQVLATQEDNDMQVAAPESQLASKFVEEPSAAAPSADSEEPAQEDVAEKTSTTMAATESSLASSLEEPKEAFEKESMAFAPSGEPAQEHSDMAVSSSETEGASDFVEEASAAAPSANFGERAHKDDADESGTIIADAESPLASSFDDPQKDFEKESSAAAPSAEPAQELATQEDSSMALAAPETTVTSKFAKDPSTAVASAGSEEPAREDADKGVTMTAAAESPLPTSHQSLQEDFEKESFTAASSAGPIHEPSSQEDSGATSDKALASSEPQVASKFVEEPSSAVPSANFEEPAREDEVDKSVTMTAAADSPLASSYQGPQEDFEKESLPAAPSAGPAHETPSLEDSGGTSDVALASSESPGGSKFVEEPSPGIPSANSEEPAQEDGAVKSDTVIAGVNSPSASSFEEPQEDFEKESMAAVPGTGPAQELATQEERNMAPASSEPKVASKFVEEPSAALPSADFEEPVHEDAADKSVTMPAAGGDPQEDFVKEPLAAPPKTGPAHELSSKEDLDATSDMAFSSSAPHLSSKFVEKSSPAIPSANSEEPAQDEGAVKSDTMSAGADSPLASSFQEPQEDFEKESLAATSSREPAQGLATEEDSHMAPTSSESQEVSKSVEEPSAAVPSADFEEPAHEDAVDKSVAMTAAGVLPFASSFEGPQEDFEKESIAAAPSIEPAQELATQEDSDKAPSEPQVSSKFVEEPSATDVPSAKFEEPAHEDTIDRNGTVTAAVESPSVSSLEEHREDYTKESLAAGASAKVLEPTEEDESGKSPIAFAPLEAPSASFFGIPQEAFSKEPSGTSVQPEEPAQEKSGIVLPGAESTLTSTAEDGNHAAKEAEYKLAEDFKVHDEHIQSTEKEFPRNQSNLAHVGSDELKPESLAAEDSDDRLESDQSGEEFFDADHGSGNFEPWESVEPESFEEFGVGPDEPGEATGINAVAQKETLISASSVEPAQEPEQAPVREPARELAQEPEQTPVRELEQEPEQAPARETEQDHESAEQAPAQEHEQQPAQEQEQHAHGQAPGQEPTQEPAQEHGHKPEQKSEQQPAQEPEQEDLTRNSAMALPPSEPQVTSKSGESQELVAEEPLASVPSTKFEEPALANAADESGTRDLPLTSTAEEPQIDTVVSPGKSLSSASFHQSGNLELLEYLEQKSSDTPGTSSTPQQALEREPLTAAPTTEFAQGHDAGKSDNVHISLEPQLEESKEALANGPVKAVPSSESTEPAQEVDYGQSGAILASSEPQLTPTLQEPQEGFVKEPLADAEAASKSVDLEESLADEPSAVATSAKLAQESVADKISAGLVEEPPLTSIAEEPQNVSLSSLVEGKHGQDEADQKFLEDVKIIAEPIEEAIPRTQSDLTHVKLKPEAAEDATKLQSEGSFLAFGPTSVDSKEAPVKEPLPSAKLLELFEENDFGKRGPVLADSSMTSAVEEPQKPLAEEPLASAKSVPKGHARRRGFARSSSEPQFAYKLEEHRKALVKESSVAAVPSASKLGEEHAQEDFPDTQCLPFRILGEGKHPRKESEFKLVEDVKSPATTSETASSYVLEPKPSKIKEKKKKKEKKERKPDAPAEEKERRLSLGLGEMERKSSLRAEEKDSKYSPRAEEKHKQPFRHLRDRLRHAFSVNKEP